MLTLIVKIALALAAAVGLALGVRAFLDIDGATVIGFQGFDLSLTTGSFIILNVVLFILAWIAVAVLRRGVGGVLSIATFYDARRRRRGLDALAQSLVSMAEGDGQRAMREADRAERLLRNNDLTRIVNAQAARMAGDERRAERYFEEMTEDPDTEYFGLVGLMRQARREGKSERALQLAERAHALRPKEGEAIDALFELHLARRDLMGARDALKAAARAGRLTRDVADRRRAVLHLSEASERDDASDPVGALEQAMAATKAAPGLTPAAALAARLLSAKGEKRLAARTLIAAWRAAPHPDLAAAFAALEPNETPSARLARFAKLFSANPDHIETRLAKAEIALAADAPDVARTALGDLDDAETTAKGFALMAAAEQAEGADDATVRAWLSRAAAAPRGARWVCDACGVVSKSWTAECGACGAFDTLAWRPVEGEPLSDEALQRLLAAAARPRQVEGPTAPERRLNGSASAPDAIEGDAAGTAIEAGDSPPPAVRAEDVEAGADQRP